MKLKEFCDGPKCGWLRPTTEAVVGGKRKKLCDECINKMGDAVKSPETGESVNPVSPEREKARAVFLVGLLSGFLMGLGVYLLLDFLANL